MFTIFLLACVVSFLVSTDGKDFIGKCLLFTGSFIAIFALIAIGAMCYKIQFGG